MKISEVIKYTEARIVAGSLDEDPSVALGFSSDLMSDVLTLDVSNVLLITGLANLQLVRTAEVADIDAVLLARGKSASAEMIELAREIGLILMETPFSIYKVSGLLYGNGLNAVY